MTKTQKPQKRFRLKDTHFITRGSLLNGDAQHIFTFEDTENSNIVYLTEKKIKKQARLAI